MKALVIFIRIVVSTFVSAMLNTWAMHTLWWWFAAAQYGAGPTMATWFGLAIIVRLALLKMDKTDSDFEWSELVTRQVTVWLLVLAALGSAWVVGATFGWVS